MLTNLTARWSRGGYAKQYDWPQCKYCGRAREKDCKPVECLACGSRQCHGNGSGNGSCGICFIGYLPHWGRHEGRKTCGYRSCEAEAVAQYPRTGQVCKEHLPRAKRTGSRALTLTEYIAEQIALRDSGKGWQRWRWVE